jgi:hypothetical protein
MLKQVKISFNHSFAEGLIQLIDEVLANKYEADDDKLVMAGLSEIRHRLYLKVEGVQKEYTMTLTAVQALSLRILYTDFINEPATYMGSKLMLISEDVAKKYTA